MTLHQSPDSETIDILHAPPTDEDSGDIKCDSPADSLRRNDARDGTTLDLDSALDLGDDLDDFLDAVHSNNTIETLQLEGEMICSLNYDQCHQLFDALGGLPLTKLHLHNFVAPLPLLTSLLQRALNLERITLHTAQLLGRDDVESREFLQAIQGLQQLQAFKCTNAIVMGAGLSLETLVQALARVHSIQKVELELERGGEVSVESLRSLCQLPQLQELRLWRLTMNEEHLILIANIVQYNDTMEHLELGEMGYADHGVASYRAVADMLRNNSTLETFGMINFSGLDDDGCVLVAEALRDNTTLLQFNMRGCDNLVMGIPAARAVADMLAHNTCLQEFAMNTVGVDNDGAIVLAQALQNNRALQSIMLQRIFGDNKARGFLAFLNMLETNYMLRRIYPEAEGDVKAKMDFYLSLNQLGLRQVQLYVDTDWHHFLDLLTKSRHDLNIIFYLLSTSPDFLDA
ncbi:leucine Rich Repeat [Seminavis robusta]|uniref:Leucine Rich Repeat n=1 Tax=Seminavis robusta TaxID=568900 RepID=A0A9N8D879_9STRA|nr:leucine Rich Repeat [Seminavis robusta]|eukprot:Sro13_g009740.1 leucine Rich Repeat (460) ;mRNA; r:18225-19604